MGVLAAEVISNRDALEALRLKELAEDVLEHVHLDAKPLQVSSRRLLAVVCSSPFK